MRLIEKIVEGLKILSKYEGHISAEHDIIYAGPDNPKEDMLEKDFERMEQLGWFVDNDIMVFAIYV